MNIELIAHRGASFDAPENTLAAFDLAIKKGFSFIECDIQFSQDHTPYLFHDDKLSRTSNGEGLFKDKLSAQIKQLDAGSWKSHVYNGEQIPSLISVAGFMKENQTLHMNWELKTDSRYFTQNYLKIIADTVLKFNLEHRIVFSSFDYELIALFQDLCPQFNYAALIDNDMALEFYRNVGFDLDAFHMSKEYFLNHFISEYNHSIDSPELRIYTVNEYKLLEKCQKLGAQKFFTDKLHPNQINF